MHAAPALNGAVAVAMNRMPSARVVCEVSPRATPAHAPHPRTALGTAFACSHARLEVGLLADDENGHDCAHFSNFRRIEAMAMLFFFFGSQHEVMMNEKAPSFRERLRFLC